MGKMITLFRNGYPFHRVAFWLCFVLSVFFLAFGLLSPPQGKIDGSVLIGVGEIFAFATLGAAIKAIEDGKDVTIHKKDLDVTIGDHGRDGFDGHDNYGESQETADPQRPEF